MRTVLVTGATGILGSNVCEMLVGRGDRARAIVRDTQSRDARALAAAGVDVVPGNISEPASVRTAIDGMDAVIHCAAVLGRPGVTLEDCFPTNVMGTIHVLSAAAAVGGIPVVQVLTSTFFDSGDGPLTEYSPLDLQFRQTDVYTLTKRLAFAEGTARIEAGQDIRFMCPGAIYGPSICLEKTVQPASFNGRLAMAVRGEMLPQLPLTVTYVAAEDCAYVCIAALDKGAKGERYLVQGRPDERATIAEYCNRACEIAGVPHRVDEIPRDQLDSPDIIARFGPTMPGLAKKAVRKTPFDNRFTQERLDYKPTSIEQGFPKTIDWMREHRFI